jgi:general secretion pathway protein I
MTAEKQFGFTLIEALVALALVAVAIIPLYEWVGRSLGTAARTADMTRQAEAELSVLAVISRVNPMEEPSGTMDIGGYRIRWQATPKTEPVDNVSYPRGVGLYQVALYDVKAEVRRGDSLWFELQVDQVGYRRVRMPQVFAPLS